MSVRSTTSIRPLKVQKMLEMVDAKPDDVLCDFGSGDGRIVIAAIRDFGVKSPTGIDIDPQQIEGTLASGRRRRLGYLLAGDLFEADFSKPKNKASAAGASNGAYATSPRPGEYKLFVTWLLQLPKRGSRAPKLAYRLLCREPCPVWSGSRSFSKDGPPAVVQHSPHVAKVQADDASLCDEL